VNVGMILGGYALAVLLAARFIHCQMRLVDPPGDQIDDVLTSVLALIIALFWPLALPVAVVMWRPRKTPAELRREVEDCREQITARDLCIAELERQLGIAPSSRG